MLIAAALPTGSRKCAPALAAQYRSRRCPPPPTPHTLAAAAAPVTAVSLCPSPRLVCGPAAVRGGARLDSQRCNRRWNRHHLAASVCAPPATGGISQARTHAGCPLACLDVPLGPSPYSPPLHVWDVTAIARFVWHALHSPRLASRRSAAAAGGGRPSKCSTTCFRCCWGVYTHDKIYPNPDNGQPPNPFQASPVGSERRHGTC